TSRVFPIGGAPVRRYHEGIAVRSCGVSVRPCGTGNGWIMAGKKGEDSGDKTEKPTPKRLRDARRDGDVPKSKELTSTVLVLLWLLMMKFAMPMMKARLFQLFDMAVASMGQPFSVALPRLGVTAVEVFAWLTLPFLLGAFVVCVIVEFLQVGPVFAPKKLKP